MPKIVVLNSKLSQIQEQSRKQSAEIVNNQSIFASALYNEVEIGDLVSWWGVIGYRSDGTMHPKHFGIVLSKEIQPIGGRNMAYIKVANSNTGKIDNIFAILLNIESKRTI